MARAQQIAEAALLRLAEEEDDGDDTEVNVVVDVDTDGDDEDDPPEEEVDFDDDGPEDREKRRELALSALRDRYGGEGVTADGDGRVKQSQAASDGIERPEPKMPRPTVYTKGPKLRAWGG